MARKTRSGWRPTSRQWKLLGLAGLAGVAATGAVVARRRREHVEYDAGELRERLHARLGEVEDEDEPARTAPGT
jgi:LPXTG-motif cell wall-anchored protein